MRSYVTVLAGIAVLTAAGCGSEGAPDAGDTAGGSGGQAAGSSTSVSESTAEQEKAAIAAAQAWLELIDNEEYAKSWEEAADLLKAAITKQQWEQTGQAVREQLGKVVSRELKSQRYATSLPGAPDGEYVVIQYNTSFEKQETIVETITPMLAEDGVWRVSGYYVK